MLKNFTQQVQEDPVDLSSSKDFLNSLEKSAPILSIKTFTLIQNETVLSDNQINQVPQLIHQDCGRLSIQPGLSEVIKVNGQKTVQSMKLEEIMFERKDKNPRNTVWSIVSNIVSNQ